MASSMRDHPLAGFRNAAIDHPAGVDPMIVFATDEFTDAQIAAYDELHVIPFNRAIRKDCATQPDPQFPGQTGFEMTTCHWLRERPEHPYTQLSDEALAELAQTDAAAANVLARRTIDPQTRYRLYLRTAALSGKSGPLLELANVEYPSVVEFGNAMAGEPRLIWQKKRLEERAALEVVAARMGDPRANPELWMGRVSEVIGDEGISRVETEAQRALEAMAAVQDEFGISRIRQIIDDSQTTGRLD